MSLMDTTDGVLMFKAYHWAFANPLRKIYYRITITGLSVVIALLIGTVQLAIGLLNLGGPILDRVADLDFSELGIAIVAIFLLAWGGSVAVWRLGRFEQRYAPVTHKHRHVHPDGVEHAHEHFHE
jgi:nickel/cobalt transporter (NiCoT) family protein